MRIELDSKDDLYELLSLSDLLVGMSRALREQKDREALDAADSKMTPEDVAKVRHEFRDADPDRMILTGDVAREAVKKCPVCGNRPTMFTESRKVWYACHTCAADGGKFEGPRFFEHVQAMIAWNAVVDAWDRGFKTAEAGAE